MVLELPKCCKSAYIINLASCPFRNWPTNIFEQPHFVTDGITSALERAVDAANGMDVRLGGGVSTIRQYLSARLIDEMHIAVSPILLGSGENLFTGIDLPSLGYQCVEHVATANATHVIIRKVK
jgi:dihydrofolate reductase